MNNILIIAGETSGDLLGAALYNALKSIHSDINCYGIGGHLMQEAGINILFHSNDLAVVGGIEIAKHFKKIYKAYQLVKKMIVQRKPDLVILIDYPGFNLRIAKIAKNNGCKVFYYVSPQIWAWRYRRIDHIKKYIDHMAVLFAFEEKIYQKAKVPVSFVGHPIKDIAKPNIDKTTTMQQLNLTSAQPIIGLFPGSRKHEVTRMLPIIVDAIPLIRKAIPMAQFILPLANSLTMDDIQPWLSSDIAVVKHNTYNALSVMDAAIAVSGTVTLEIAIQKVPLVVIYKLSAISYNIAKRIIRVPYIALCNLVAENQIAKELIQNAATPEAIAFEIIQLLTNNDYRQSVINKFDAVIKNLGTSGASERTAKAALNLIKC